MKLALYGDGGYYKSEQQKSARRGDYITSVEVGPLFGAVMARALDAWWELAGCPKEFYVFDAGAGVGTLARSILRAEPKCLKSLKYILLEQSEYLSSQHKDLLERKDVYVESFNVDIKGASYPPVDFGIIIANELLDNLPVVLLEKTTDDWAEVFVCFEDGKFVGEELAPASSLSKKLAAQLAPKAEVGQRIPLQNYLSQWLKSAASILRQGKIVVLDYGVLNTNELSSRPQAEWLRTYRQHARGKSPYEYIGEQDITCEVALDQLNIIAKDLQLQSQDPLTQSDFLKQWGIDELLAEAHANIPKEQLPTDLKTIELKSRLLEAEALLDPLGLGSHLVMQWDITSQ